MFGLGAEETLLLLVFASPPLLVLLFGLCKFALDRYQINTYKPIQVKIVSKRLGGGYNKGALAEKRGNYFPVVDYTYEVDGKTFSSKQVTPSHQAPVYAKKGLFLHGDDYSGAQQILNRFEENQTYEGYYDPKRPERSILVKEYDTSVSEMITFSVLYMVVMLIVKLVYY